MATSAGTARSAGWICPRCHRRFARARQWHSCKPRLVSAHFAGKDPAVRELFDHLMRRLEKTGPFRVDAVKTSIHLISRHHFSGIAVRRGYLRVSFLAKRQIRSSRIVRTQVLGPRRVEHVVIIGAQADIDVELVEWLSHARQLQS